MDINEMLDRFRIPHVGNDFVVDGMRVNRLYGLWELIQENLKKDAVVCEVGSYMGHSASLFAHYCKLLYCVDIFSEQQYESRFDFNMSGFQNVVKIKNTSADASDLFDFFSLDMVYIDAGHEYDDVMTDIIYWKSKVKTGGFLAGHDYHNKSSSVVDVLNDLHIKPDKIYEDSSWIKRM